MIIAHLTSAHQRSSSRIFSKMCKSSIKLGKVYLVCADGKGDEIVNNINILDIGRSKNRIMRMTVSVNLIYKKAISLDADIYHLHDPELIPIGLKLLKDGKKVVFDSHEHIANQILSKIYIPKFIRYLISVIYAIYEKYSLKKFSGLIGATPNIRDHLLKINPYTIDINNFPVLSEIQKDDERYVKSNDIVYIGSISKIRGVEEIILAMEYVKSVRLNLAGKFNEKSFKQKVKKYTAWQKVNELGFLNRQEIADLLANSKIGIVTLYPKINYIDSLPVKMFEYMAAGIPVIASNFPLWKEIVEGNNCGICVDPLDPKEIGGAIQYLIDNPKESEKMGKNGLRAAINTYNWSLQEKKLFSFYKQTLNTQSIKS